MQEKREFLTPAPGVDSDNELIRERAIELTRGLKDDAEKGINLFYWVRDEIKYRPLVPLGLFDDYRASKTLESGVGFCVEKAALLIALARGRGNSGPISSCGHPKSSHFRQDYEGNKDKCVHMPWLLRAFS